MSSVGLPTSPASAALCHCCTRRCLPPASMSDSTPQQKHSILTHYRAHDRGAGFDALARRFAVAGGGRTIQRWHSRWDGTAASLQHASGAGRPRTLSSAQVTRHVKATHPRRQPSPRSSALPRHTPSRAGGDWHRPITPHVASLRKGGAQSEAKERQEENNRRE